MSNLLKSAVLMTLSVLLATGGGVRAQQDPDTLIRLNLSTPGARSLAMGGAFLALADDATAAYTNPAGLTNLTLGGSEVAVELRQSQFRNTYNHSGRAAGQPRFIGVDTSEGLLRGAARSEATGISFLSFAYVLPRGLTLAVYRHELANFATEFETGGPLFDTECDPGVPSDAPGGQCVRRLFPRLTQTELEIVNYGVSAAYELELPPLKGMESTLSLGLGVSYYDFELSAFDANFGIRIFGFDEPSRLTGGFFGPPDFLLDNLFSATLQDGDDDAFGVNLGWLWKLGRQQRWSIGGVFRQGPDFETRAVFSSLLGQSTDTGTFHVPDVFGLGGAYRSTGGKTKITFDVNRIRYSQRLTDFTQNLPKPGDLLLFDRRFSGDPADFTIEDADQLHLGVERIFLVVESLFVGTVRCGVWNEPFHELEYTGNNELLRALQRPTDDEIHFSAGLGLVIKEDYQVDLAADLSDLGDTFSFSLAKFL